MLEALNTGKLHNERTLSAYEGVSEGFNEFNIKYALNQEEIAQYISNFLDDKNYPISANLAMLEFAKTNINQEDSQNE